MRVDRTRCAGGTLGAMKERGPGARGETARGALRRALREGPATARDLSVAVGIREKDVAEHLAHLARSLAHEGERLVVEPASCIACGYRFSERSRLSRPGACPRCRSTRIDPPVFRVERADG
jgi:predicted Zn-ribbon and HTH transcriptional regulator